MTVHWLAAVNVDVVSNSPKQTNELQELVNRVDRAATEYNMLINAVKPEVTTNTDEVVEVRLRQIGASRRAMQMR